MTTESVVTPGTAVQAGRRRFGTLLATGAPLFAAGVAGEWVLAPQRPDGSVDSAPAFGVCVGVSLVGAVLLLRGISGTAGPAPQGRAVRWGRRTAVAGSVLLALAVAAVLVTGLASGAPHPASFVPYALGILALAAGPLVLGAGLRRAQPPLAAVLTVAGLAAFASVAIPLDPWHDVSLMAMLAAWTVVGVLLRRG